MAKNTTPANTTNAKSNPITTKRKFKGTEIVTITNAYDGVLIVPLTKAGYSITFSDRGESADVELSELKLLRAQYAKFFEKNWIEILDPNVLEYLGVDKFYKGYIPTEELDALFNLSDEEMVAKIEQTSSGQKDTIAYMAMRLIESEVIDSKAKIKALQKVLNFAGTENE